MTKKIVVFVVLLLISCSSVPVLAEEAQQQQIDDTAILESINEEIVNEGENWVEFREDFSEFLEEYMEHLAEIREEITFYIGSEEEPGPGLHDDAQVVLQLQELSTRLDYLGWYVVGSGVAVVVALAAMLLFQMLRKGAA